MHFGFCKLRSNKKSLDLLVLLSYYFSATTASIPSWQKIFYSFLKKFVTSYLAITSQLFPNRDFLQTCGNKYFTAALKTQGH
jgi:hypothetical protein